MNCKQASDIELWGYCQQDDIKAYNELFDRYVPALYRQATRYIRNEHDAEEIVMDLMFNIWEKRSRLDNMGENVKAYLYRSLHNRVINHLQRNKPKTVAIEEISDDGFVTTSGTDHQLIYNELSQAFENKLAQLSPQRKQVFKLCREENLSYKQVATILGLSVNTVENHMASALRFLRNSTHDLIATFIVAFLF